MNNSQSSQQLIAQMIPTLVIDLKKNRIRIHKKTLHMLGDPEYVQILVNPQKSTIAIRNCNADDYRSERIKWQLISGRQCCEFYSKYLIKCLRGVCFDWKDDRSYRIDGKLIASENLAQFSMTKSVLIEGLDINNE